MNTRFLLKLLDSGFVLKTAFLMLLFSLVLFCEIFLIQFISEFWGSYFTLALAAATGLIGLVFSFRDISSIIKLVKASTAEGNYPDKEVLLLSGAIAGGVLLIIPGFATDLLGVLCFFPFIRMLVGKILTRNLSEKLNELYEYLKLYE